ncbi:MAG: ABC transporter ATP-binding protein, partial [Desulfobacterales bacterium]|nr:ABC transporter ATP-binding protein [Desulfobacterales bacterium]
GLSMLKDFEPLKTYFIENRIALILGLSSLLLVDFLQLLIPRIIKKSIDVLTAGLASSGLLLKYALIIVGIAIAMAIFRYIWRFLVFGHSRKVEEALRNRMYEHLQTLSLSFYWKTRTGDLMARAVNDIDAVRMATGMGLVALTDGVVLGLATVGFMLYIDIRLTLISLIPTPFIVYFTLIITRRMGRDFRRVQQTFSELTESVREGFAGIRVIKAYNRQPWEYRRVKDQGEIYVKNNLDLARTLALFFPMMTLFTNLGLAVVIWIGGRLTILGDITTGDFVAFISYLNLLTWPMMALGWVTNLIQRASVSMRRVNEILHEVPEITNQTANPFRGVMRGQICLKHVTFYYPNEPYPALNDVDLTIEAGHTVAIVGGVGSGKSTLLQIIPRLMETKGGMVQIDGIPIHDIDLKNLRGSIGFVTQESHIFSDTISNNIIFGRHGISKDLINTALEVSQLTADIGSFPQGIHSHLGEKGVTLSGGQRQRLTIARALISSPPILILDDALSQVDTRTEATILNSILEMRNGETNIIVSHRLSTIRRADIIYVLRAGRLVERGEHTALLAAQKEYARLYERQQLSEELERGR